MRIRARHIITDERFVLRPPVKFTPCFLFLAVIGLALGTSACSKCAEPTDASQPLQKSFTSEAEPVQQAINSAIASLKAGNYTEATRTLTSVVTTRQLTEAQRQAVGVALQQVNQAVAADPKLNTKEMYEMRQKLSQAGLSKTRF